MSEKASLQNAEQTLEAAQPRRHTAYPEYRPSAVDWLGDVPLDWKVKRLKFLAQLINEKVEVDVETYQPYVGMEHVQSWTGRLLPLNNDFVPTGISNVFQSGDVLFGKLRPYLAKATTVDFKGHCSSELMVLRPQEVDRRFLLYALLSDGFIKLVDSSTYGAKMPRANWEFIGSMRIPVPSPDEQQVIARFLDEQTKKIDDLIGAKRELLNQLKQKRLALVHNAIMAASGRTERLGRVVNRVRRPIDRRDDDEYTAVGLYNWGRGIFHKKSTAGADLGDSDFFWVESGDLILSGQFAWEGAVALAGESETGCVATHRYHMLRGMADVIDTAYLFAFFTTNFGQHLLDDNSRGAAGRNRPLNIGMLLKEEIPVPPLEYQEPVSSLVNFETSFIAELEASFALLYEYRQALISAAVTGKIDVRGGAA